MTALSNISSSGSRLVRRIWRVFGPTTKRPRGHTCRDGHEHGGRRSDFQLPSLVHGFENVTLLRRIVAEPDETGSQPRQHVVGQTVVICQQRELCSPCRGRSGRRVQAAAVMVTVTVHGGTFGGARGGGGRRGGGGSSGGRGSRLVMVMTLVGTFNPGGRFGRCVRGCGRVSGGAGRDAGNAHIVLFRGRIFIMQLVVTSSSEQIHKTLAKSPAGKILNRHGSQRSHIPHAVARHPRRFTPTVNFASTAPAALNRVAFDCPDLTFD